MGGLDWIQLGAAALSGSALPSIIAFAWRRLRRDPKAEAEARNLEVQTDGLIVTRLYAEIERLDHEVSDLREQLVNERQECADQMAEMQGQIRQLQQQQASNGHISGQPLAGSLLRAFPPDHSDKDTDLVDQLKKVPSRRKPGDGR